MSDDLYINTEDGNSVGHPAYLSNLTDAFHEIPPSWKPFVRSIQPILGTYYTLSQPEPTYENGGGVFTDRWHVRDMNMIERAAKDEAIAEVELLIGVIQ